MTQKYFFFLVFLSLLSLDLFSQKKVSCLISTDFGTIGIDLYPEQAPVTVANFLKYVDQNLYDGTTFYRVCTPENEKERKIKIEVIQGGDVAESRQLEPIRMETTRQTGLKHLVGSLSMARDTPDSATSSFFICIGNQPELDFAGKRNPDGQGFAVFGKVTRGMQVVRMIQKQENKNQYLIQPVKIISIKRSHT
jgi:peptidyl-prolyl cis-trans isomerase A (cyclophilin A)